jgi:hypothetical protein
MSPFDLPRPEFLQFYVFLAVCLVLVAYLLLRHLHLSADESQEKALHLTPFQVVHLARADELAVHAAMLNPVRQVTVKTSERPIAPTLTPLPADVDRFDEAHSRAIRPDGIPVKDLQSSAVMSESTRDTVVLRYSLWKAGCTLIVAAGCFLVSVLFCGGVMPGVPSHPLSLYFGVLVAVAGMGGAWEGVHRIRTRVPRLVLDAEGLTDYRESPEGRRIRWAAIRAVDFRDADEGGPAKLVLQIAEGDAKPTTVDIPLDGLNWSPTEIHAWVRQKQSGQH